MPFEQYRAMCLKDCETLLDDGKWRADAIRRVSWIAFGVAVVSGMAACSLILEYMWISLFLDSISVAFGAAFILLREDSFAVFQRCLQRRQNIMDSLDRITKAFEE